MSFALAVLVVAGFALVVQRLGLPDRAREVGRRARESLEILGDRGRDDRSKERALRRQSGRLLRLLGLLVGGSALALGLPLLAVWLLELAGLASLAGVLSVLERADFLVAVTVAGTVAYLAVRKLRGR